jgi:hypothetical protein
MTSIVELTRLGKGPLRNHRLIVGRGFRIGGWLLGVPSLGALLLICTSLFVLRPSPDRSSYLDIGTYGIAGLLANGARGIGKVFEWFGGIAAWIEEALAVGLVGAVLFAAALVFTGRGIARQSAPARIVALALSVVFLFFWLVVLLSLPRGAMLVPAAGVGASLYAIWALGWRYV